MRVERRHLNVIEHAVNPGAGDGGERGRNNGGLGVISAQRNDYADDEADNDSEKKPTDDADQHDKAPMRDDAVEKKADAVERQGLANQMRRLTR